MSEQDQSGFDLSRGLTIKDVLGFSNPGQAEWSRLHGPQYAQLKQRIVARLAIHTLGLSLAIYLLFDVASLPLLGLWAALVVATAVDSARVDANLADADQRMLTRREYYRHAINAAMKGAVWTIPILALAPPGDALVFGGLWAIAGMLMLTASVTRFNAPLSAVLFCWTLGLGTTVGLFLAEFYVLAAIAAFSGLCGGLGSVEGAKAEYSARIAQHGMHEKSEVVSLLLREYEDSEADWLFQLDTNRRLCSVSPRLAFALGKDPTEVEGKSFLELISGENWERGDFPPSLRDLANKIRNRENFSNLVVQVEIEGERRWWELSGTPMLDDEGIYSGFRGVGSDVTAQRESSEKIAYLARYDTLTSLPNRLMLHEALGDALKYADKWRTRCAFLMIDLDRFKAVNDSLGHLIGDQLLAQVAARLKEITGEKALCGRLGGDEFAVVIRDAADKTRVDAVADSIIQRLSEPYKVENHVLYVGASVGSALGPRDGRTVEELMRNADLSLYRAKDIGGGEHCEYEPKLHASAEERRQLEFSLRNALKNEELLLNFQPVVDATSEEIVSFEALVRWSSPEHGLVSPGKFVPLAEDTRLIVPIGQWVLQKACEEAMNWPRNIKINVNVSPEQLVEPDFVTTVVRALSQSGLAPHRLEIEVTESIFLRDANVASRSLEQVMALGCSVALDDFGTGYSSLGYLRQLKFSTIKVDRLFVQGASQNSSESLAIIRAVVAMAQSLGMSTTAEGVETADEAALIRELGCDKIQGFHFGRPMSIEETHKIFGQDGKALAG